jgi:hypothetical protein
MTEHTSKKDFDINSLLHPAQAFRSPMDVVDDPDLTTNEKRAILASWASDACTVQDLPPLRRPPNAPPVSFDDVMDALRALDGFKVDKPAHGKLLTRAQRWKSIFTPRAKTEGPIIDLRRRQNRPPRRSPRGGGTNHSPLV